MKWNEWTHEKQTIQNLDCTWAHTLNKHIYRIKKEHLLLSSNECSRKIIKSHHDYQNLFKHNYIKLFLILLCIPIIWQRIFKENLIIFSWWFHPYFFNDFSYFNITWNHHLIFYNGVLKSSWANHFTNINSDIWSFPYRM